MEMKQEDIYVFNPEYLLKPDKNRILITRRSNDPRITDFIGFVHPVYAILLSLFDGEKELAGVIRSAVSILKKDQAIISRIVLPLLENKETLYFRFEDRDFSLPEQLLVKKSSVFSYEKLNPESFFIPKKDLDFENWRLNTPLDALFMINTRGLKDFAWHVIF